MSLQIVTAAFLPLLDASILVAAREIGFAREQGIDLVLVRETSWANIRDRVAIGHFDAAHMLAPMPIASNLGLTPFSLQLIAPMALGLGGNAITVSRNLYAAMGEPDHADPSGSGERLRRTIEQRRSAGEPKLRFGVVHPHSSHNFELRYWLSACGIDPECDIEIVILPPPYMTDALGQGNIDGYCVGEPWNQSAVSSGSGRLVTTKNAIWASSPEKVLGVRKDWADEHPEVLAALIRVLYHAARWCGSAANRTELSNILSKSIYLDLDAGLIKTALSGTAGFEPFTQAATFPWQSHALWFYSQMVRWGQVDHKAAHVETARQTYRPDLYRAALAPVGAVIPTANAKVEGALTENVPVGATGGVLHLGPDGFFDKQIFDPHLIDGYIDAQRRD